MAKDLIDDIRRPKRSLQDILPGAPSVTIKTAAPASVFDKERSRHQWRWPLVLLFVLTITITAVYFVSTIFGQATVIVTSRRVPLLIQGTFRAVNLPSATASSTELGFQTMTIRDNDFITVPVGETTKVSERAKGTIVIANRYSSISQRLVANTRFETATGKIYRIHDSVLVPGYTLVNKTLSPGELTVTVIADQPGADYNGTFSTLTIPGFKNDARFNTITARAKTSFTGGFVGERKTIGSDDRAAAETELNRRLKGRLLAEAASQTPSDYVWYPGSVFWRLGEASTTEVSSSQMIKLSRQVELVAPIFSRVELSQTLARRFVPNYDGAPVLLEKLGDLKFQLAGAPIDPEHLPELIFTLAGGGDLVWQFDVVALARDLTGRGAGDYQSAFVKYPSIVAAKAAFHPPWLVSFPTDPQRVIIQETSPSGGTNLTVDTPPARISGTTTTSQSDTPNDY